MRATLLIFLAVHLNLSFAIQVPIYHFPTKTYNFKNSQPNRNLVSLKFQQIKLQQLYKRYYSEDLSPWGAKLVTSNLADLKTTQHAILKKFASGKKHFGENFKQHDHHWLVKIKENMALSKISPFKQQNRAITVANTFVRTLPELAPDFYHLSLPGQGFPFDNLLESAIWVGTPLYVYNKSADKAWALVLTPDCYFGWVKSSDIAFVSPKFVKSWQKAAKKKLLAITKTKVSIYNKQEQFQFTGYIGAVFPMLEQTTDYNKFLIPVKNQNNQAVITAGFVVSDAATLMPLRATTNNLFRIIKQLENRPYGWGGAYFFNDCSQELKSLFTPFGIWLPRNSAQQAKLGFVLDLSKETTAKRLEILKAKAHPMLTIIYVDSHVMLYIGKTKLTNAKEVALTYQNVWGLASVNNDKRYVIGKSLFLPLLENYFGNFDIKSAASKEHFKLIFIDEMRF